MLAWTLCACVQTRKNVCQIFRMPTSQGSFPAKNFKPQRPSHPKNHPTKARYDGIGQNSNASFAKLPATAAHSPLFRLAVTDLRSYVLGQDIIYVGGGNTRNMLTQWRE
jgi:Peptidase family S51